MRLLLVIVAAGLAGCAAVQKNEAAQQGRWLTESGFRVLVADNPERRAALEKIPPFRMERHVSENTVVYRFADPAAGKLYVGGPDEYAAYRDLAVTTRARRASTLSRINPSTSRVIGPLSW